MTVADAADYLDLPEWTARRLGATGAIPIEYEQGGRGRPRILFRRADVVAYLVAQIPDAARADVAEALAPRRRR